MKVKYTFDKSGTVVLPVGVKKCKIWIDRSGDIKEVGYFKSGGAETANSFEFPVINGKSPNTFNVSLAPGTNYVNFLIEELGGVPDPNYFSDTPTVIPEIIPDKPTEQEENKDAI